MEKATESAHHYFEMGLRLLQAGDCQNAIDLLSIAIDLNSQFGEAYGYRGLAYFNLGTYQEAMDNYNIALSLDSSLENVYFLQGYTSSSAQALSRCGKRFHCCP